MMERTEAVNMVKVKIDVWKKKFEELLKEAKMNET
jgi:hypothetical protein